MVAAAQLPLVGPAVTVLDALNELTGKGHGCVLVVAGSDAPLLCAFPSPLLMLGWTFLRKSLAVARTNGEGAYLVSIIFDI